MSDIQIVVSPDGTAKAIYSDDSGVLALMEAIDPRATIQRASHVEPTEDRQWTADMSPSGGPVLGPYPLRQQALAAELDWLRTNVIGALS